MKLNNVPFVLIVALLMTTAGCKEKSDDPIPEEVVVNGDENENGDPITPADFITDKTYKFLVIDIVADSGFAPSNRAQNNFSSFLSQTVKKPGGIQIRLHNIEPTGTRTVDLAAIKKFEGKNRKHTTSGDTIFAWFSFLDAKYIEEPGTDLGFDIRLAHTYGRTSVAVFVKQLNEITLPDMVSRFTLETYIFEHEFSHLLGLVNNGTAMVTPHQDEAHGSHCSNPQCLMFWKADDNMVLADLLGTDVLPTLDANCIADLKAAGGK